MSNGSNFTFSTSNNNSSPSMSNNNSNFSAHNNSDNSTSSTGGNSSDDNNSGNASVSDYILVSILFLTITVALGYTILLFVRKTFRTNKHNWFIINICMTTQFLSAVMLSMSLAKIMNTSSYSSCRLQVFIPIMAACQMMYAHVVVSISRFLTIVYANKRLFRSTACVCILIGVGWIVALLLAVPFLVTDSFACSGTGQLVYLPYYMMTMIFIIPVLIVLILNIRIFLFVRRSTRRVQGENGRNNISQSRDVRLVKIMVITFSIFVIGWGPLFLGQIFMGIITIPSILNQIFQVLPGLSMLADIILLLCTNQPIRQFIGQLFVRQRQLNLRTIRANTKVDVVH